MIHNILMREVGSELPAYSGCKNKWAEEFVHMDLDKACVCAHERVGLFKCGVFPPGMTQTVECIRPEMRIGILQFKAVNQTVKSNIPPPPHTQTQCTLNRGQYFNK